mgnify:CR=1 FL=1
MAAGGDRDGYGRGAAVLSVGIGITGLVTYAYFALASHSLTEAEYGRITLLWSAVFVTVCILYRPVEQLLSRTIADRAARGAAGNAHHVGAGQRIAEECLRSEPGEPHGRARGQGHHDPRQAYRQENPRRCVVAGVA